MTALRRRLKRSSRHSKTVLMAPSTKSVLTVGEEALSKSILRLGEIDFCRYDPKPTICDFKPVVGGCFGKASSAVTVDEPFSAHDFANRVPNL